MKPTLKKYFRIYWLPALLAVFLVLETYLFNRWLDIIPHLYFARRTAVTVGLGALLFGPAVFFKNRSSRYIYLLVVSVLLAAIFISEFLYYRYSGGFLEFAAVFYARQSSELGGTIKILFTPELLLFIAPLVMIGAGYFAEKFNRQFFSIEPLTAKEKLAALALIAFLFISGYGALFALEKHDWGDTSRLYSKVYDLGTLVGKMGIVNFYVEDAVKYALQNNHITSAQTAFASSWARKNESAKPQAQNFGIAKSRNLILIQVESMENWLINATADGQEITPNLNKLAKQGMYFDDYYSQIGEGNTADAEFSTMNSLYPLPDSVAFISHPNNQTDALPEDLKQGGYTTAVMHGDVDTFWNRSNVYPGLGYEKTFSQSDFTESRPIGFDGLGDSDFFSQAVPKLQSLQQPFMSTLITLSMHTPFYVPEDLQTLKIVNNDTAHPDPKTSDDGDIDLFTTRLEYVQSAHYTDAAIGQFIDNLKKTGLYDNSVIVIYGDHNAFLETADSAANQVPMILLAPGLPLTGTNPEPASHLDLYPTLTNLLGVPTPKYVLGQDLLNTKTPVATQRNVLTGTIKFIDSKDMKYVASDDGIFGDGQCLDKNTGKQLDVNECAELYDQEQNKIQISDIVVRYNQLKLLLNN